MLARPQLGRTWPSDGISRPEYAVNQEIAEGDTVSNT